MKKEVAVVNKFAVTFAPQRSRPTDPDSWYIDLENDTEKVTRLFSEHLFPYTLKS